MSNVVDARSRTVSAALLRMHGRTATYTPPDDADVPTVDSVTILLTLDPPLAILDVGQRTDIRRGIVRVKSSALSGAPIIGGHFTGIAGLTIPGNAALVIVEPPRLVDGWYRCVVETRAQREVNPKRRNEQ